jgi:8-oxo-dGTP diphosphatase
MSDQFPLIGDDWSEEAIYRGALLIPVDRQGLIPVDRQGRILLQLRDYGPDAVHPGKWGLFGGGVEGEESLTEAVVREFAEEVGVMVSPSSVRPFARGLSGPDKRRLFVFCAELDITPADIRLGEGAGFGFIEPRNVNALDLVPFARDVLETFLSGARRGSKAVLQAEMVTFPSMPSARHREAARGFLETANR